MNRQNTASGLVLAGGMGRRINLQDKGLLLFCDRPLVSYALTAMSPVVDQLLISANRNLDKYREFGYPVLSDASDRFDGPLAGILAGLKAARYPVLLIAPCDSPLVGTPHLQRLLEALTPPFDVAMASDGQRRHPVFAALRTTLLADLQAYLLAGERKVETWFFRHRVTEVDFSDSPELFANINTLSQLQETKSLLR